MMEYFMRFSSRDFRKLRISLRDIDVPETEA